MSQIPRKYRFQFGDEVNFGDTGGGAVDPSEGPSAYDVNNLPMQPRPDMQKELNPLSGVQPQGKKPMPTWLRTLMASGIGGMGGMGGRGGAGALAGAGIGAGLAGVLTYLGNKYDWGGSKKSTKSTSTDTTKPTGALDIDFHRGGSVGRKTMPRKMRFADGGPFGVAPGAAPNPQAIMAALQAAQQGGPPPGPPAPAGPPPGGPPPGGLGGPPPGGPGGPPPGVGSITPMAPGANPLAAAAAQQAALAPSGASFGGAPGAGVANPAALGAALSGLGGGAAPAAPAAPVVPPAVAQASPAALHAASRMPGRRPYRTGGAVTDGDAADPIALKKGGKVKAKTKRPKMPKAPPPMSPYEYEDDEGTAPTAAAPPPGPPAGLSAGPPPGPPMAKGGPVKKAEGGACDDKMAEGGAVKKAEGGPVKKAAGGQIPKKAKGGPIAKKAKGGVVIKKAKGGKTPKFAAGGVAKVRRGFPNTNKRPGKANFAKGGKVRGCGIAKKGTSFSGIF